MKKVKLYFTWIVFILLFHISVNAQHVLKNSVFCNGCARCSGDNNYITGSIDQLAIGTASNSTNRIFTGFWYYADQLFTHVDRVSMVKPTNFQLYQNYPNPFNPTTTIRFAIPEPSPVSLILYNMPGKEIISIVTEHFSPGNTVCCLMPRNWQAVCTFIVLRQRDLMIPKKSLC